jgi:D-beta-D-heptose 7-phosphate kinase/D-beta-D-heptose 1-phosphate adenosyltransferase
MSSLDGVSQTYEEFAKSIREAGERLYPGEGYNRIVFTNGCFDILHLGHLQVLHTAREHAGARGAVIVGVNSDSSVHRLKGEGRPIQDEETRAILLIHLRLVDHVITFEEDTPYELIKALRPHVIVKGGDYDPKTVVGSDLALVVASPLIEGRSTSETVEKIRGT